MSWFENTRIVKAVATVTFTVVGSAAAFAVPTVLAAEPPTTPLAVATIPQVIPGTTLPTFTAPADDTPRVIAAAKRAKKPTPKRCDNDLVLTLRAAGFKGPNVKEAWAIAMRESNGQAHLGPGHPQFNGSDYGLFQFNQPSWGSADWFDPNLLLNGDYNASIAYMLSDGGNDWIHWGLNGDGTPNFAMYSSIWSANQMQAWIVEPYERYSAEFDSLPLGCRTS